MEVHCSTGQSPQWAVVPMEEEEEDHPIEVACQCDITVRDQLCN